MPNILRVALADEERRDLHALLGRRDLTRYSRQRGERMRLLDQGRSVAEVASVLECHPVTVRATVHRFVKGGIAGLPDALRPGRPARLLGVEDRAALGELLDYSGQAGITWGVPALCEWLRAERGVEISSDWLGELLRREGFCRKRTRDSVRHKADPVLQQAAWAQLEDLRPCVRPHTRENAI
ncbi:helix-turn-helix domain-containing protein [Streptomyces kanamyceticus]|uniref:Helix-turn-helix domain-containing protein n=1 Tax=Streptomyces kanamyceticus TaxID=1967 RepID=A0A5J6GRC9_STRKN|nr:helix-turn-helix domain-containing protein [Streptomyces kanamyceticus]QEU96924.1 helix-turn-helix domain-containing protein [Streptomyces kanamyceticus]